MYKLSIVHVHFVQIITQAKPSYSTHYNVHKSAACTKQVIYQWRMEGTGGSMSQIVGLPNKLIQAYHQYGVGSSPAL
jgi:hypothetical protein